MDKFTMRIRALTLSLAALITLTLGGCVSEDEPNEIGVSQQVLLFEPDADFTYVTLTANSPWRAWVESDNGAAAWCRLGTTAGGSSQQVQIMVEANSSAAPRSARIFFENTTSKPMRTSILVSQSGVKDHFGD